MTPLQRTAWLEMGFWIGATILFLGLLFEVGPGPAQAAFALIGLLPLAAYLANRRPGGFASALDERDQEISARASRHGLAVSYVVFILGIVGIHQWGLRAGGCVPTDVLMAVFWVAVALQALARAASVIGQARSQERPGP